jgi:hypothetical protein
MSIMLSRYLKDFGDPSPSAPIIDIDDFATEAVAAFAELPKEPEIDVEAERREAYSEGFAAATVELTEKYEHEAQAAAEAHMREIEELKLRYEIEAAAVIASRIRDMAEEIATVVSEATATAIAPVMTEELSVKAVENLAVLLREAILDGAVAPIVVRGPVKLFDILKDKLAEHTALLRHLEADDIDLAVEIGETVLVTRISAWAASVKKVSE